MATADTRDPTDTDSLEAELGRQNAKARQRTDQIATDIKWLMAHKQGRRIVWRYLSEAGVYRSSFVKGETEFREGMRNMGLLILNDVHTHSPDRYVEMLTENRKDA